jgi:predicted trehalose synthase
VGRASVEAVSEAVGSVGEDPAALGEAVVGEVLMALGEAVVGKDPATPGEATVVKVWRWMRRRGRAWR